MGHDQAQEGRLDAKRGKLFTKLIKEITVAARMGGGDPASNPRLRKAIADAKGQSMPADTIKRAVKRGTGELEGANYEEILYEGTGPGGTLFLVEGVTDNRNRTVAEIRKIFEKNNGELGGAGVGAWAFDRKGLITLDKDAATEDQLMEIAVGAGAEDYTDEGEEWPITTPAGVARGRPQGARGREDRREGSRSSRSCPRTRSRSPAATPRSASTSPRRSTITTTCRTSTPTSTSPTRSSRRFS